MPLCISKMDQMPKMLMKTRKCMTGPHASACFQNEQNAKNALESEKMNNRATCLSVFQKWAKCQKRLKSTELKNLIIEVRLSGK